MPTSFRKICIRKLSTADNFDEMVTKLVNLEQIAIEEAAPKGLKALINGAPRRKTITISTVESTIADINLTKWNQQRENVAQACKVTIYVDEGTYLTVRDVEIDIHHNLVEMKRHESCQWEHDFDIRLYAHY